MATVLIIPLENDTPAFSFFTDLDGNSYQFKFRWNDRVNLWMFDMYDNEDNALFLGKPFQTDVHFLKSVPEITKPPGILFCANSSNYEVDADRFALGADVKFYYVEEGYGQV